MSDGLGTYLAEVELHSEHWWTLNDLERRNLFDEALNRWTGLDRMVQLYGHNAGLSWQERCGSIIGSADAIAGRTAPAPPVRPRPSHFGIYLRPEASGFPYVVLAWRDGDGQDSVVVGRTESVETARELIPGRCVQQSTQDGDPEDLVELWA